jgi:spore maturation protein CgeB
LKICDIIKIRNEKQLFIFEFLEVHITLVFFNQNFLVQKEVISALRQINGIKLIVIDIAPTPSMSQVQQLCTILDEHKCNLVFSINEWGIDTEGMLCAFFEQNKIIHINWCVDDPFFEETMHQKKFRTTSLRVDFVSDDDYVEKMRRSGYNAHFLPLATDPAIFHPGNFNFMHEISFVGNSYISQIDSFIKHDIDFMETIVPLLTEPLNCFRDNNQFDIEAQLLDIVKNAKLPSGLPEQRAIFLCKHFAGYLYRKETVLSLISHFDCFTVYGDLGWLQFIDKNRFKSVSYGEGLCKVYNSTRINIDINRPVIKNGFTQRVFDCLASGSFLISSEKPVVKQFFETTGNKKELITFKNTSELTDLVSYYLRHENERMQIARRGYEKVSNYHTYSKRIRELFTILSKEIKKIPA